MIEHFTLSLRSQPAFPIGTDACFLEQFWLLLPGRGWDMLYWGHVWFFVCVALLSLMLSGSVLVLDVHHAMLPTAFAK